MEDIPIYEVTLDPKFQSGENELGMDEIAFTSDPAILVKGVAFKNHKKELFADEKKYRITAPAMIPMDIYRADEEGEYEVRFTEQTIEEIHSKFMANLKNHNLFNVEHESELRAPAYILEAWIVDNPKQDKAFSTFGIEVPKGTLMLTAQITNKGFYEEIVKQERFGFSIEAFLGLQEASKFNTQHNMELPNGKFSLDGKEYEVIDGQITEVQLSEVEEEKVENSEAVAEETVVAEAVAEAPVVEVAMEEDKEEEEVVVEAMEEPKTEEVEEEMAEEVVEEVPSDVVTPSMLEEFKAEVLQILADYRNEIDESAEEATVEDSEVKMSKASKFSNLVNFLKTN